MCGSPGDALSTFEVERGRSGPEQGRETVDVERCNVQQPEVDTTQCADKEEGVATVGTGGDDVQPASSTHPVGEETGTQVPPVGTAEEWVTGVREPEKAAERGESDARREATAGGMTTARRVSMMVGQRRPQLWKSRLLKEWSRAGVALPT